MFHKKYEAESVLPVRVSYARGYESNHPYRKHHRSYESFCVVSVKHRWH
jgi:hypothetical protein